MIAVTLQMKLLAIVFLALMNMLLLKRKKSDKDSIQSYTLQGEQSFNINNNKQTDPKQNNDSLQIKYQYAQKVVNLNHNLQQIFVLNENKHSKEQQKLFFVRIQNKETNCQQTNNKEQQQFKELIYKNQQQNQSNKISLPFNQQAESINFNLQKKQQNKNQKSFKAQNENAFITPPFIPMQVQQKQDQFQDINYESKSQYKSNSNSFKNIQKPKPHPPSSERKFIEPRYPLQEQFQSDSNTKRTLINIRNKQKTDCKNHCNCCKNQQNPRSLKRCIQDLIYTSFQEMIQKDSIEHSFGHKKKKRSL